MKKLVALVLKIILILGTALSLLLTLSAPITVKTSTPGLVKHVINEAAQKSGNSDIQNGVALFRALGVEDAVLEKLPKKLQLQTSLLDFYQFGTNYQKQGRLTAEDLHLPAENDQQKTVNDLLMKFANEQLKDSQPQINEGIHYFKIFFYVVIGLYVLAILLMLFNKRLAIIPLLLGAVGTYSILSYGSSNVAQELQTAIYSGIKVTLASNFTTSTMLAVIIAIVGFFAAGMNKKKIGRHAA